MESLYENHSLHSSFPLLSLQEFIEGNVAFSMKSDFREEFCMKNVRSGVVSKFISHVLDLGKVCCSSQVSYTLGLAQGLSLGLAETAIGVA